LGLGAPTAACQWDDLRFYCSDEPSPVQSGPWEMVAVGGSHTCAIDQHNAVWCWGSNLHGQLGAPTIDRCSAPGGNHPCSRTPIRVRIDPPVRLVAAGASHTCALDMEGLAHCWGMNRFGQAGSGAGGGATAVRAIQADLRFLTIEAGAYHTCGVTADGSLYCWGRDGHGEVRAGTAGRCAGTRCTEVPVRSVSGRFSDVAAGFGVTCARREGGRLTCWGKGDEEFAEPHRGTAISMPAPRGLRRLRAEVGGRWQRAFRFIERLAKLSS
jgi:alpha-tubulin suppressor-like RCC1 family protein